MERKGLFLLDFFPPFFFSSHFFSTVFTQFSWHCLGAFFEGGRKTPRVGLEEGGKKIPS